VERVNKKLYWECAGKVFYNKWQALDHSRSTGKPIHFNFFDNDFSQYNWSQEPSESWDEILKKRALQLREKYDYIRLFYSGGVDSQTMLETFLKHNIPLEEILIYRGSAFTDNLDEEPADDEIKHVALPYLESVSQQLAGTKITILETGASALNKIVNEDYFYEESTFALRIWCERHLYRREPKLLEPFEKGLLHCDLRGGDKPKIFLEDGKYYMAMYDSSRIWDMGDEFLENFYLTPDMPEVHAKQCHMVKNFFKFKYPEQLSIKEFFNVFDTEKLEVINRVCRVPRYKEVNLGKGITGVLSTKQILVQRGARLHNPRLYDTWISFLNNEGGVHKERFNNGNITDDFVGILSKKYSLE
jgi:hypothetical protein